MKAEYIVLNKERNVSLTAYLLDVGGEFRYVNKRPAVFVIPGGGYQFCSDREADPVAMAFLQAGYDAFVFPTWSENFGHVISEALFSGCPAIISDQTPWLGLEQAGVGWNIPLNDSIKYRKAIQKIVDLSSFEETKMRESAKTFAWSIKS